MPPFCTCLPTKRSQLFQRLSCSLEWNMAVDFGHNLSRVDFLGLQMFGVSFASGSSGSPSFGRRKLSKTLDGSFKTAPGAPYFGAFRLGPHEPPSVHSLADLNTVLHQEVPRINKLLMENVPRAIGDCDALLAQRPSVKDHCNEVPMAPLDVSPVGLSARVVFIDGLSTLRIKKLRVRHGAAVMPEKNHNSDDERSAQRWAIDIQGQFSDLNVFARASQGMDQLLNAYICCHNPYHVGLQLSVLCSDPEGFSGNVTVDDFHIDQVSLNTRWQLEMSGAAEQSMLEIDMGGDIDGPEDLVHREIKKHLESIIIDKTGGAKPVKAGLPPLSLTAILNKVLRFNGGEERCPKAKS
ncbi:unnamed protein product [Cladocopium goreaui]|uniref:Uncharacterized protein n=1 Tax=Cladocopium goreaui TaxID=2562237 RepID=A0A9P1BNG5_9DINO|nr:unnamed protein product [Cladocopium goreaui]